MFRSTHGGATWTPANQGLTATALRTLIAGPAEHDAFAPNPAVDFAAAIAAKAGRK